MYMCMESCAWSYMYRMYLHIYTYTCVEIIVIHYTACTYVRMYVPRELVVPVLANVRGTFSATRKRSTLPSSSERANKRPQLNLKHSDHTNKLYSCSAMSPPMQCHAPTHTVPHPHPHSATPSATPSHTPVSLSRGGIMDQHHLHKQTRADASVIMPYPQTRQWANVVVLQEYHNNHSHQS